MNISPAAIATLLFLICLQMVSVVFRFAGKRPQAVGALLVENLPFLVASVADVLRSEHLPANDIKWMGAECALLAVTILSFWRFAQFCFWLVWVVYLVAIGTLVYLAFFWHVFS